MHMVRAIRRTGPRRTGREQGRAAESASRRRAERAIEANRSEGRSDVSTEVNVPIIVLWGLCMGYAPPPHTQQLCYVTVCLSSSFRLCYLTVRLQLHGTPWLAGCSRPHIHAQRLVLASSAHRVRQVDR